MGLLGEVQAARQASRPGVPCIVERLRVALKGQDLKDFNEALDGDRSLYPSTALTDVLNARGHKVARGAIDNHRARRCRCYSGR